MKNNLIVPGIFNLIISLFWLVISFPDNYVTLSIGMFLVVVGVLCIMYSKLDVEKLYEKRNVLLTFGIISIPFNLISAVLLLIESDKVKREYAKYLNEKDVQILDKDNKNVKVSKEVKKLDILLKIGIGMVSVAGIMIATTSWDVISDFVKMLLIALIGFVFLGLSIFSEKKLKIRGTTITYWILSMIAFSLSVFMIGNYQLLGEWFSVDGEGASIFLLFHILHTKSLIYNHFYIFHVSELLLH